MSRSARVIAVGVAVLLLVASRLPFLIGNADWGIVSPEHLYMIADPAAVSGWKGQQGLEHLSIGLLDPGRYTEQYHAGALWIAGAIRQVGLLTGGRGVFDMKLVGLCLTSRRERRLVGHRGGILLSLTLWPRHVSLRLEVAMARLRISCFVLIFGLAGCGGAATDDDVARLQQQLDDMGEALAALQADHDALVAKQQSDADALTADMAANTTDIATNAADIGGIYTDLSEAYELMSFLDVDPADSSVVFSGVNVYVQSGAGSTAETVNGTGNLIIGYDENDGADIKSGSHNLVIGPNHTYLSFGAVVGGEDNTASGEHVTVFGRLNEAAGTYSSVTAGHENVAMGTYSAVSGGRGGQAAAYISTVSGGYLNEATGQYASVCAGRLNIAQGDYSSVTAGYTNLAEGRYSTVYGGQLITEATDYGYSP